MQLEDVLEQHRVLPVLTIGGAAAGRRLGEALVAGGLALAEVTLRAEGAEQALAAMAAMDEMVVGVGTVLLPEQVDRAVDAGAAFVVTPGLHREVVDRCAERGVPIIPGTATATEMMQALARGLTTVKLFPAGLLGGPDAVRAYAAPFPQLRFVPTGGVGPDNVAAYLNHPSVLAAGGSWLAPRDLVEAGRWTEIEQRVRATVAQVNTMQEDH